MREGGPARIVFSEGDERVLRAVQVVDEGLARPILVGRRRLAKAHRKAGPAPAPGEDVEVTNPEYDERFHQYWTTYWELMPSRHRVLEGEDERVLRACRWWCEGLARPILVGRPSVLLARIESWACACAWGGRGSHQPRI